MKNKEILIISECFYPEEFKINELALFWKDQGFEISVLTLNPTYPKGEILRGYKNKLFQKEVYKGIKIYRVYAITGYTESVFKKILKYLCFMFLASIFSLFLGKRCNYVFGYNIGALTDMLPAVIVKKIYRKPLMLWVQDIWPDSIYAYGFKENRINSFFLNIFVKFIYSNVTKFGISGKGFASKLKYFSRSKEDFYYLPNWADPIDASQKSVSLSIEKKVQFTFAGNIGKVQNLENIINAFISLKDEYQRRSQLNIIGDGSNLENLKDISIRNKNIIYHGKIQRDKMSGYYSSSDFLIVSLIDKPIFQVTVPAKIQTYIANKKPILGVIKGDSADLISQNKLGLCVDPANIDLIREALEKCINMTEKDKLNFTKNSENLLNGLFNKNKIMREVTNILTN